MDQQSPPGLWSLWVTGTLMEPGVNLWVRCGQPAVHSLSIGYPRIHAGYP